MTRVRRVGAETTKAPTQFAEAGGGLYTPSRTWLRCGDADSHESDPRGQKKSASATRRANVPPSARTARVMAAAARDALI